MDDDSGFGLNQSWGSALLQGVSAVVDSQLANQFGVNTPTASTQYGVAGQPATVARAPISPAIWIAAAVAGALLLILVLKK